MIVLFRMVGGVIDNPFQMAPTWGFLSICKEPQCSRWWILGIFVLPHLFQRNGGARSRKPWWRSCRSYQVGNRSFLLKDTPLLALSYLCCCCCCIFAIPGKLYYFVTSSSPTCTPSLPCTLWLDPQWLALCGTSFLKRKILWDLTHSSFWDLDLWFALFWKRLLQAGSAISLRAFGTKAMNWGANQVRE